jgi:hypothetical protein
MIKVCSLLGLIVPDRIQLLLPEKIISQLLSQESKVPLTSESLKSGQIPRSIEDIDTIKQIIKAPGAASVVIPNVINALQSEWVIQKQLVNLLLEVIIFICLICLIL